MAISAVDGWTEDDTKLIEHVLINKKSSGSSVPMVLVINKVDCAPFVCGEQFESSVASSQNKSRHVRSLVKAFPSWRVL